MFKIAVTGYRGNVGSRLVKDYGYAPLCCDVCKPVEVEIAINTMKPDVIVHLAGKSNVNWCEAEENQESAILSNFRGSAIVFEYAAKLEIPVVYVSSDHIFDGNLFGKYSEQAKANPKNHYGLTKLAAESLSLVYPNVHIVRTSTLFWKESQSIAGLFSDIMSGKDVYLPTYMWRSFLHIDHFCELLASYCLNINDNPPRVLNLSGSKVVSWYRFIVDYAKAQGLSTDKIHPKYFEDKNEGYAPRAMRAGLDTKLSAALGYPQYSYLDGIS